MYKAMFISPMIPSFNIADTTRFFKAVLGFSPVMETEEYAICKKDNLTIHILPAGKDIGQMEFYMEVDNIDELWVSVKDNVKGLKVKKLIRDVARLLRPGGVFYLSTMEDDYSRSGWQRPSTGGQAKMYIHYHQADCLTAVLKENGLEIVDLQRKVYMAPDGGGTTDLLVVAKK